MPAPPSFTPARVRTMRSAGCVRIVSRLDERPTNEREGPHISQSTRLHGAAYREVQLTT